MTRDEQIGWRAKAMIGESWAKGMRMAALFAGVLLLCANFVSAGTAPSLTEDQVKALFLFNFTRYIEWPEEAFATRHSPLVIGVIGKAEINVELSEIAKGRQIYGRVIVAKKVTEDDDLRECHVLFVRGAKTSRMKEVLAKADGLPILTVGEHERFLSEGGMINFTLKGENVRLEVNLRASREANLMLSSHLLRVADIVVQDKPSAE